MGKISTTPVGVVAVRFSGTLLVAIAFFLGVANSWGPIQPPVISFAYTSFPRDSSTGDLMYKGHAHVQSNTTYLRLTNTDASGTVPRRRSVSQVLYINLMTFSGRDGGQRSFETTFEFSITPNNRTGGAADGITFFIASGESTVWKAPPGAPGGSLGIFDSNGRGANVFAVEFDTFHNPGWDIRRRHIGIDIGSRRSKIVTPFDSGTGERVTAHIQYDAVTKVTTVRATTSSSQTAELSYKYDLKKILTKDVRVGISAATGDNPALLGIHDIHSWKFKSTYHNKPLVDPTKVVGDATLVVHDATDVGW